MTTADADSGIVRIAHLQAATGKLDDLLVAARTNADEARQAPGCRSAEVCVVPDDPNALLVISRWRTASTLEAFLGWHEGVAHKMIREASGDTPRAVHHPIVAAG